MIVRDATPRYGGPKYSGEALREALQTAIGDKRLADALHPV